MKTFVSNTHQQNIHLAQRWGGLGRSWLEMWNCSSRQGRGAGGERGVLGKQEEEEGCPGRGSSGSGFIQARSWQTPGREVELL